MISTNECIYIGRLSKTHGVNGGIQLRNPDGIPEWIEKIKLLLLLLDNQPVPFFPDEINVQSHTSVVVHFEEINTIDKAENYRDIEVYILAEHKPKTKKKLNSDEPDMIGYIASDVHHGIIGTIDGLLDLKRNPLFEINKGEILIPINEAFIKEVNHKERTILFDLPEGFLDINK